MLNFSRALIIAAHPDDDVLGCGGTIAKLINLGKKVRVIFIAEGTSCRFDYKEQHYLNDIEIRNNCAVEALKVLGVDDFMFYNLACGRLDTKPIIDIAKIVEKEIVNFLPDTIFTHYFNDTHVDHKIVFQATLQATRPTGKSIVNNLLSFEILSSTEWKYTDSFGPNFFVDISDTIDKKILSINKYFTEQPSFPHPRSDKVIKSLAIFRGSQSNCHYAESFKLIRSFN